jgi:uncharacterized protein YhaN
VDFITHTLLPLPLLLLLLLLPYACAHKPMSYQTRIVALLLQAADGTTTLAQQLPKALQQSILQQVSEDNGTPELLSVLVRCAADVQLAQEQQLAQQQGEIAQLRRELRGVQASLAAVLQQLQGQAGPGRV